MGRIVVTNSITLDSVMQAPARPDEDTRGGFRHGGWALPYNDSVMAEAMASRISQGAGGSMLLGRRTYEDFASVWPQMPEDNPYTKVINERRKYVVSSTLEEPLAWNNSVLLKGDTIEAVRALKAESDLAILGSGELVQSLMRADLIDEFVLLIHPLVLGEGIRLFPDAGAYATLRLVDSLTTTTGVIIATYQPVPRSS